MVNRPLHIPREVLMQMFTDTKFVITLIAPIIITIVISTRIIIIILIVIITSP